MESRQVLRSIAKQLRCAAQDVEAVAVEGFRSISSVSVTPTSPELKLHPWEELRDIAELLRRVRMPDPDDRVEARTATHRLEEIADAMEDAYEHARDY